MELHEYLERDGLALGALISAREVRAEEVLDAALAQLERVEPVIHSVVHTSVETARARARRIDRTRGEEGGVPFLGVPLLVKDLLTEVAGEPYSCGSRLLEGYVSPRDAPVVERFRAAGTVIVGKTTVPEFGLLPFTEPDRFGACRNPWDPSRTPGGSSGGSAAAVAAGVVPVASGNDGAGSIRIPAACCGLFGLKPGRGRVPTGEEGVQAWRGLVTEHVLSRSVRDSAAMLDALTEPELREGASLPRPEGSFLDEVGRDPGRLRVAYTTRSDLGGEVDPACSAAAEEAASLLDAMGHRVEEAAPGLEVERFVRSFLIVVASELAVDLEEGGVAAGRTPGPRWVEPETWALRGHGHRTRGPDYAEALRELERIGRRWLRFFEEWDLLVSPTLTALPPRVGSMRRPPLERWALSLLERLRLDAIVHRLGFVTQEAEKAFAFTPFTPLFNVTGQPAMSVPLAWSDEGLPVGVHVGAGPGAEATLLRIAGRLEEARPWFGRRPDWIGEGA